MNIRRSSVVGLAAGALAIGVSLAGCGHDDATSSKTTTSYQGKPDTPPWANSRWHDSKEEWGRAIKAREQNQNDYARMP